MGTCSKNLNLNIRVLDLGNPPNSNHHVQDHRGIGHLVLGSAQSPIVTGLCRLRQLLVGEDCPFPYASLRTAHSLFISFLVCTYMQQVYHVP